jgi:DNA-binding HxlR family transcriptional regulator
VSRTLQIIGDRWSFKVLREAFLGARRFDEFRDRLSIAPNILTDRLERLVGRGIFDRRQYQRLPNRYEYRLTEMGLDLYGPFAAIMAWGDRWLSERQPIILSHKTCGHDFVPRVVCDRCGEPIVAWEMAYTLNYTDA